MFTFSDYGREECICDKYCFCPKEDITTFIQETLMKMDEEIKSIVTKCGISINEVFVIKENICKINKILLSSLQAYGSTKIGDFTIECLHNHPVERDYAEITIFKEEVQEEKYEQFKDGAVTFRVFCDINGERKEIYCHSEHVIFDGYISFMETQIGGEFGLRGYQFSLESGMMVKDEERTKYINDLMLFFEYFKSLLEQNLVDNQEETKNNGIVRIFC